MSGAKVRRAGVAARPSQADPNFFPGYQVQGRTLQILFLNACLQLALQVSVAEATAHDAAAARCFITPAATAIQISHSASGYTEKVSSISRTAKARSKVNLNCQRTKTGFKLKIRPRNRGPKLRSTIGPTLPIGFANSGSHAVGLKIAFTVK